MEQKIGKDLGYDNANAGWNIRDKDYNQDFKGFVIFCDRTKFKNKCTIFNSIIYIVYF
jgi:hypothetical protein